MGEKVQIQNRRGEFRRKHMNVVVLFFWLDLCRFKRSECELDLFKVNMQKPVKQPTHSHEWSVSSLVFVTCHTVQVLHSLIKRSGF